MKHAPPCYQGLFEDFVLKWIEMAGERAKDRLKTAVRLDQIVKYSDKAAFSSSAVDAHTIFTQIISFWRDLKWLDRTQSIEYLKIILKLIKDLSLFYADEIFDKEELAKNENNLLIVTDRVSSSLASACDYIATI
jgi:HD superfamily phosphodiesterase